MHLYLERMCICTVQLSQFCCEGYSISKAERMDFNMCVMEIN